MLLLVNSMVLLYLNQLACSSKEYELFVIILPTANKRFIIIFIDDEREPPFLRTPVPVLPCAKNHTPAA